MYTIQGFSLSEVLIALFLISSISVGLTCQQWQASRVLNQSDHSLHSEMASDNRSERFWAISHADK